MPRSKGWYPDPNDSDSEIYWDGARWQGRRQASIPAAELTEAADDTDTSSVAMSPTEHAARYWHGLSDSTKTAAVIGTILVAALIVLLIQKPWESKYHDGCEHQTKGYGVSPTDPSFEGYVDLCVERLEQAERDAH